MLMLTLSAVYDNEVDAAAAADVVVVVVAAKDASAQSAADWEDHSQSKTPPG